MRLFFCIFLTVLLNSITLAQTPIGKVSGLIDSSGKQTLKEVTVTAKKPMIEQKTDRTIINVDAMITIAGSSALDALSKSPGVTVDMNGNISLNGKGGVLILIDDKLTYMSAQDLAAYLRSLPAGLLDKIELMSNPPAKYDASGSAIINIQLKRNRTAGFNGNISLGYSQGFYARSNDALNINYRNKKFNLFSNLSYSKDRNYSNETFNRYFYNPDDSPASTLLMNSRYTYQSDSWNLRSGLDYFVSYKTTIGILFTGNTRPKTDGLGYTSNQYNADMKLDSITTGLTDGKYHWNGNSINLNLQHKFDSIGTTLNADLDHVTYHSYSTQFSPEWMYLPDGSLSSDNNMLNKLSSEISIYSLKADYTQPLPAKMRFDAGFKASYVTNDNNINWFNRAGAIFIPDHSKTNHFIYRENINAVYINTTKEWARWSIQAGLRLENTRSHGHQSGNMIVRDSSFSKNYTDIFPTFYLSYKLDNAGNNTLRLTFQKRIRRPNYQQLNPFLSYRDKYSYSAGNPYLRRHLNNFIGLQYSYKTYFGASLYYGRINGIIQSLTQAVGDTFITRPQNFGTNYSFDFIPYVSVSPLKGWDLNATLIMFYLVNKGNAYGQTVDNKVITAELGMNNQLRLGHGWSAELNGTFGTSHKGGQTISGPGWNMSAGLQKNILQNKAVLRLKMDDIFHTRIRRETIIGLDQASAYRRVEMDSRIIGLSFNYRFGKATNARKRNHNSGATDEQGRAN